VSAPAGAHDLRLTVVRGGGVAGIVVRSELTAGDLPADDHRHLLAALARCRMDDLSARAPAPGGGQPDELRYELSLTSSLGDCSVRLGERELPPAVRSLIDWIDGLPQVTRAVSGP